MVSNNTICKYDSLGQEPMGHHIIPRKIFSRIINDEVKKFLEKGEINRIFNEYYTGHNGKLYSGISAKQYSDILEEELKNFLGPSAIENMTKTQAEKFKKKWVICQQITLFHVTIMQ
jgi:hypothetical protein